MEDQNQNINVTTSGVLRWISGIASAFLVPTTFVLIQTINKASDAIIRIEGKFDVMDVRLREFERTQERNEKRLEYLEQLYRTQNPKK